MRSLLASMAEDIGAKESQNLSTYLSKVGWKETDQIAELVVDFKGYSREKLQQEANQEGVSLERRTASKFLFHLEQGFGCWLLVVGCWLLVVSC